MKLLCSTTVAALAGLALTSPLPNSNHDLKKRAGCADGYNRLYLHDGSSDNISCSDYSTTTSSTGPTAAAVKSIGVKTVTPVVAPTTSKLRTGSTNSPVAKRSANKNVNKRPNPNFEAEILDDLKAHDNSLPCGDFDSADRPECLVP